MFLVEYYTFLHTLYFCPVIRQKELFHIEISKLIKKLCIERNLSQSQLTAEISPRSTLSSLELNGTRVSFHLLEKYLDRMNVSLAEFELLLNEQNLSEKKQLSRDLHQIYYQGEYSKLHDKLPQILLCYQETKDFYYYSLFGQYSLILSYKKRFSLDLESSRNIQQTFETYLDSVETWGAFEFSIFANTLMVYSSDFILQAIQNLNSKKAGFEQLYKIYQIEITTITNAIILLFDRKELASAQLLITLFASKIQPADINSKLLLRYFKGMVLLSSGNPKGWSLVHPVVDSFHFVEMSDYGYELLEYAKELFENAKKSVV